MASGKEKKEIKNSDLIDTPRTIEFYHLLQMDADSDKPDIDLIVKTILEIDEKERWIKLDGNNERFDFRYEGKGEYLHKLKIGITRSRVRDRKLDTKTAQSGTLPLQDHEETCVESHLMVFPNNFVGFEFNPSGARLSYLTEFFDKKTKLGRLEFHVAADKDFERNLSRVKKFHSVSMSIDDGNSQLYAQADPDYTKAVEAERARVGAKRIKTVYFADPKKDSITKFGKDWAKKIFAISGVDSKKVFSKMKIKFDGPENEDAVKRSIINLTCSKITAKRDFPFEQPVSRKNIDSEKAYALIRSAYDECLPRLKQSIAVD